MFEYKSADVNKILQQCYYLFPTEVVDFKGITFKRGMNVRATTNQKKIIEGKLIGQNNYRIVCIITKAYIFTYDLNAIENIIEIGDGNNMIF